MSASSEDFYAEEVVDGEFSAEERAHLERTDLLVVDQPSSASPADADDGAVPPSEGREAAKYRRRLREVETERDTLTGQVETLRRQMVEQSSGLTRPEALWAAGVDVAALFTDDGTLDRTALRAAVVDASERLGLALSPRAPRPDRSQGMGVTSGAASGDAWSRAFRP